MAEPRNPLMDLFADKPRSDEEITAELKGTVVEDADDDEDENDDEDGDKPDKDVKGEEPDDEDDDDGIEPDEKGMVPVGAIRKEREKWQKRIAKLEGKIDGVAAASRKPEVVEGEEEEFEIPDPAKDPKGYASYVQEGTRQLMINERMNTSERFAIKEHGKEKVDNAFKWCEDQFKKNPDFARKIIASTDPYGDAVALYDADLRAGKLKDVDDKELDELRRYKKAKKEGKLTEFFAEQEAAATKGDKKGRKKTAETQEKPAKKAARRPDPDEDDDVDEDDDETPPSSLAGEQAARGKDSGEVGVGAGEAFKSIFR